MQYIDQLNRSINLPQLPQRIVSLVPSQTELLFDLGLGDRVVGVTKFCIHPAAEVKKKIKVGGTKNFNFDVIAQLRPDLIIGNKEENYQEGIERLEQHFPVWMSDIYTLEDALQMMVSLGELTGTENQGQALIQEITRQFSSLEPLSPPMPAAYFIWRKPYMGVGNQNFIDHLLAHCGFVNVLGNRARYPEVTPEEIKAANPALILLSSEPYPFQVKHFSEFKAICPEAQIRVVDGELFSWYGSRLRLSVPYFRKLLLDVQTHSNKP